ncbi:hypothetical protein [Paenibacillus sp. NFR01]|uniref:hypothetical protein n=1 Tax=Paenibacillus sp. NFR01 TaxID=1566279 RepID=UPI0008D560CC|nr:hypothetical protein [Paenibacillus sp. NFR01]SET68734.1 hypothetical protein SAMN03159358_2402 [Paenibacillus sp. NFR01]
MEKYKMKLRNRTNNLSLLAIGSAMIYLALLLTRNLLPDLPSFIKGFHTGVFVGLELFVILYIGKYMKARKDEAALKRLYIKETDERSGQIFQNAATLGLAVILVGLALAAVVAGFFDSVVFFSLLGALFFVIIVFFALLAYYSRKL